MRKRLLRRLKQIKVLPSKSGVLLRNIHYSIIALDVFKSLYGISSLMFVVVVVVCSLYFAVLLITPFP